jgi:hypothetical protein
MNNSYQPLAHGYDGAAPQAIAWATSLGLSHCLSAICSAVMRVIYHGDTESPTRVRNGEEFNTENTEGRSRNQMRKFCDSRWTESGRGLPHSKTCRSFAGLPHTRRFIVS